MSDEQQAPTETPQPPVSVNPKSVLTDDDKRELNLKVLTTATDVMDPVVYEQQRKIAQQMFDSKALPGTYANVEQVFMAIQIGRSAGLNPYQAVTYGYFIDGSYNIYGMNTPLVIRNGGYRIGFFDESDESCSVKLTNPNTGEEIVETYTFQEAVDSGFVMKWSSKQNKQIESLGWKKGSNRRRKLRYGVLSLALHTVIPQVMGGIAGIVEYTQDYQDAKFTHEHDRDEERRARIDRAAAMRQTMNGQPQVIDPIEADSVAMKEEAEAALSQEASA